MPATSQMKCLKLWQSRHLEDFFVTKTTGTIDNSCLRAVFHEVVDTVCCKMQCQFQDNDKLLLAIASLSELDFLKLQTLSSLGISLPSKEELVVVKEHLKRHGKADSFDEIFKQQVAFQDT
jgi:hypothetical protein